MPSAAKDRYLRLLAEFQRLDETDDVGGCAKLCDHILAAMLEVQSLLVAQQQRVRESDGAAGHTMILRAELEEIRSYLRGLQELFGRARERADRDE